MDALKIMENATSYTTGAYMKAYYPQVEKGRTTYNRLEDKALNYSALSLISVLYHEQGLCNNYTRQNNLRYDLASIGADGIKKELLKNVVNVALWHRNNDTRASKQNGEVFSDNMSNDEIAVVLFNNMVNQGVERGVELLSNSEILQKVCYTFADYRREGKKENLDYVATTDPRVMYFNRELDIYYSRYGNNSYDSTGYGQK